MSEIEVVLRTWEFNRGRTLALLDAVAEQPNPQVVLGWRPGPNRAHIAWQLMHVAIAEELFATERFSGSAPEFANLVPRFQGGSTPDDDIPSVDEIRQVLEATRGHLVDLLSGLSDSDLEMVPEPLQERGWDLRTVLQVLSWHEPHHQGQAHITLNLYKAAHDG